MRLNGKAAIGVVLSILLLWWTLRGEDPAAILREIGQADPWLFLLAVIVATLGLVPRAIRWGILLRPVNHDIPFRSRFAATSIGFAANNLLPARVGEFARAFSLSRVSEVPTAAAFGSLVIERVLDGLVVVGLLFAVMALPSFPSIAQTGIDLQSAALVMVAAMGAVGLALFALVVAPERSARVLGAVVGRILPASFRRPVLDALQAFIRGVSVLRSGRLFLISLAWALGQWLFLAVSFWLAFRAFGIDEAGFVAAIFLQSLIALAVALPSAPGFFGPYQAAAKLGLGLWAVPTEKVAAFAIGFHLGGFIPVTLIGVYFLWRLGIGWKDVGRSEEVVEEGVEREYGDPESPADGGTADGEDRAHRSRTDGEGMHRSIAAEVRRA
jgi:glycosyltransferase 2 family protein